MSMETSVLFRWSGDLLNAATKIVATTDDSTYECSLGAFSIPPAVLGQVAGVPCSMFGPAFAG
jgi:hypothetical protein